MLVEIPRFLAFDCRLESLLVSLRSPPVPEETFAGGASCPIHSTIERSPVRTAASSSSSPQASKNSISHAASPVSPAAVPRAVPNVAARRAAVLAVAAAAVAALAATARCSPRRALRAAARLAYLSAQPATGPSTVETASAISHSRPVQPLVGAVAVAVGAAGSLGQPGLNEEGAHLRAPSSFVFRSS